MRSESDNISEPVSPRDSIVFYVNGHRRELRGSAVARSTLLSYLRESEGLTGAKLCCGEGGCGACTVLVTRRGVCHDAINACLAPLASVDGTSITTVEALAGPGRSDLTPLQRSLASAHASQCGFCTPGFVMSAYAGLCQRAQDGMTAELRDLEDCLDGNLCRCTGYRPILDGLRNMLEDTEGDPVQCYRPSCGSVKSDEVHVDSSTVGSSQSYQSYDHRVDSSKMKPVPLPFPPELETYKPGELNIGDVWYRPVTLDRLLDLRLTYPQAKLVGGNTELGIEAKKKVGDRPRFISCTAVPDIATVRDDPSEGLIIGAAVTWSTLLSAIEDAVARRVGTAQRYQTSSLEALQKQLSLFAGKQIRNIATVAGNIVTASPISDFNPLWIATGSTMFIIDARTKTTRSVQAKDFFLAYRKVDLAPTEVLLSVSVPWNLDQYDVTYAFKTSRRKHDDIAIVSAGFRIRVEPPNFVDDDMTSSWKIVDARIGLGGMDAKAIAATEVEKSLKGACLSVDSVNATLDVASSSLALREDAPGGMAPYRLSLVLGFLYKTFVKLSKHLTKVRSASTYAIGEPAITGPILELDASKYDGIIDFSDRRQAKSGSQIYSSSSFQNGRAGLSNHNYHVGKPISHSSAKVQVTGEARYLDDFPKVAPNELQAALVLSSRAHAKVLDVDIYKAMCIEGVHDVILADDVLGRNEFGPTIIHDEFCFAREVVTCVGQVIGVVVAETLQQAEEGAAAIVVDYEDLPAVVMLEEAIEADESHPGSHLVTQHEISVGSVDEAFSVGQREGRYIRGQMRIGAQEHFYLEPHGSIVVPGEDDEFTVYSSTQATSKTQELVAHVLDVPVHKVVCRVKRIGGGFGGKETRSVFVSVAAAVAAQKTRRPVRLILPRDVDMLTTGTRHAFLAKYECSYSDNARVSALKIEMFLNMGNSHDLSIPVLDRALLHCQNCYDVENVHFLGRAYKTNSPSSTAFRGFGGPQGMLIAETVLEHVAAVSGMERHVVRDINLYGKHGNGCCSTVGMSFDPRPLVLCWDGVLEDSVYEERKADIERFNSENRYRKRGISAIPTMFGISFTYKVFNQAGALVHVYHTDGTVLIAHGGVEMGQGLHTKICQVAATAFQIPLGKVFVSETASDKVANAAPTAASASSDLYGMAVLDACNQINARLATVRCKHSHISGWEDLVHEAWLERVDLSAHGFYRTPSLDVVDLSQKGAKGRPFYYYTNGAAVSVVEVDTLTGQHVVLSAHIVMDVGRPLNPAIDVGQIEGAFVQGLGWCTMEEVVRGSITTHRWLRPGQMHTRGPGTYKIPSYSDIPENFNVRILADVRNEQSTIHSSKGIGEPPLFLASSVFFAIRHAITAARRDAGVQGWFELDSPASVERIRSACPDDILLRVGSQDIDIRPSLAL